MKQHIFFNFPNCITMIVLIKSLKYTVFSCHIKKSPLVFKCWVLFFYRTYIMCVKFSAYIALKLLFSLLIVSSTFYIFGWYHLNIVSVFISYNPIHLLYIFASLARILVYFTPTLVCLWNRIVLMFLCCSLNLMCVFNLTIK